MKKSLKIIAIIAGGLLALFLVLVVGLTLLLDPNDYKDKITAVVKEKSGRELKIEGKLGWSFFPWIGIETGALELSNAAGFGPEPFARIDAAGVKIKLLPLLHKQIAVDTVLLDGLKLHLAKNAAGKTNWEDLTTPVKTEKTAEPPAAPGEALSVAGISINKIDIRKADITWSNESAGTRYGVRNLDLQTGQIVMGAPVNMHLSFDLESGQPPLNTRVDLTSRVGFDPKTQALDVSSLSLKLADLTLQATLQGSRILDAPVFSGTLEVANFNPRTLINKLGIKFETVDKNALTALSLKTKFSATSDNVELKDLNISIDESHVNGMLALHNFSKPVYRLDLGIDQIDIDRYLPPAAATAAAPASTTPAAATAPMEVPLSALRELTLQAKFRIQKFKAMNLHSSDVTMLVAAENGLITLGPNQAKLYGGKYAGHTTLDVRGKTPLLGIAESVSGVELAPMLKDALKFDKFTGTANLSAKLTAQGLDARQIKETLNGTASFAVQNGAIKGIDLKKMETTITDAIKQKSIEALKELAPKENDTTPFSQLNGSAKITNGVVNNDDLKLQSPDLVRVSGKGTADLPRETLDYTVTVGSFPIRITGIFAKLKFRPDTDTLIKAKAEKKIEEKKIELKENLENKLRDKLKLFQGR